jgi:phosphate-selective porin OprO and OprP
MSKTLLNALGVLTLCCVSGLGVAYAEDEGVRAGSNGLEYRSEDGNFRVALGGRLHLDAASVDDGGVSTDDQEVRRARLELSLRLFDDLRLRVDREFTNDGGWRNVWLRYDFSDSFNVKAGNFTAPFSMEDMGSSNDTMFMERSLANALAPGFGVGLGGTLEGEQFTLSAAYVGDAIDAEDNIQAEKGQGVAVRGTWAPVDDDSQTFHFGVGMERREFDAGDVRRISTGPEASLGPTIVSTGAIANVDTSSSYNLEAAYSFGTVLLQGQYISSDIGRSVGGDLGFSGYYAQAGWILTGERHDYSKGAGGFAGPAPEHGWGAVELAVRVSSLDLADAATGGQADDVTAGINWYIGRNFRIMANYVSSEVDGVTPAQDREVDVVEARAQVNF